MANIRIKDQTTDTALVAGDYVIVDNATEGTRKFDLGQKLVDIDDDITDVKSDLEELQSEAGVTADLKSALLACFQNVAWVGNDGQDYYDMLESCLFPDATVSYISCVYTQSAVVYTDTSLNDLKDDLVVTAHWSDGTTTTVPSNMYTLTGTLTAGTSVITVTFGQKTTTFNVTVAQGVPSDYTVYDYIKMPVYRNGLTKDKWIILKQYEDLNVLSAEFVIKPLSGTPSSPAFIGRRSASGNTSSWAFYANESGGVMYVGSHLHGADAPTDGTRLLLTPNVVQTLKYTNTTASPSYLQVNDGEASLATWANSNVLNLAPVLFGNPINDATNNFSQNVELGRTTLFNLNGDIVGRYYPVVRNSDNRIGYFDIVGQVFYTTESSAYSTVGNANCYYAVGNWS